MSALLAEIVMVVHGAMLVFFVVGGFLAWKWPKLIWLHLLIGLWNITIVLVDFPCPVTAVEKHLRRDAGQVPYEGGYIKHYVDGTVYPAGHTWLAEIIGFALVVISYIGFTWIMLRRRRRRRASVTPA
ncbi:DUF2784 domain-containing protein [Kribbella deserti]|uniref:DUF2784 domain-containing protein n=1 Tax=Kribbella deserti TaxID=1926257 RepID=A0ABV6QK41_9ACTN